MQTQPLDDRDVAPWVEVEQDDEERACQKEREAEDRDMEAAPSEPY